MKRKQYMRTRQKPRTHGVGTIKDRSVMRIVKRKTMTPRQFWAHVAKLPLR